MDSSSVEPAAARAARFPALLVARLLAAVVTAAGLVALAGAWLDTVALRGVLHDALQMKSHAALALALAGAGLSLRAGHGRSARIPAVVMGLAASAIGLATLVQYVVASDLELDLFANQGPSFNTLPGPMSPLVACALVLAGAAIALVRRRPGRWIVRVCATHVAVIGAVALAGHAWNAFAFVPAAWLPPVAPVTAVALVLLAAGVLVLDGRMVRALRREWLAPEERALSLSFWALVLVLAAAVGWTYRSNLHFVHASQSVEGSVRARLHLAQLRGCAAAWGAAGTREEPGCTSELLRLQADLAGDAVQASGARSLGHLLGVPAVPGSAAAVEQLVASMDAREEKRLEERERHLASDRAAMLVSLLLTVIVASATFGALTRRTRQQLRHSNAAREEVEAQKVLLQKVIDSSSDLIVYKDGRGRYLGCNEAYAAMCGRLPDQIVGRAASELFPPAECARIREEDEVVLASNGEVRAEMAMTAPDGSPVLMDVVRSPLRARNGAVIGVLAVARNITDRKRAEEDMRRARTAAEQAVQVKSAFLASMSHEIRTPMTGVLGMIDLLAAEDLPRRQRQYVEAMRASGRHLLNVINDILDYSRLEAGRLETEHIDFSLPDLLERLRSLLHPLAHERGIELAFELSPSVPTVVTGDPTRVQQVLLNLAGNAIKFTPQGRVTVRVRALPRGERECLLMFEVQDTGIGIPPEKLASLFAPFMQADHSISRQYGGSGLGLAISQRLSAAMGGSLEATSTPGLGSIFTLQLTLPVGAVPAGTPRAKLSHEPARPRRILVAEDNQINRDILQAALAAQGHRLVFAANGLEALDLVQRESFDLVLMDVQMPGMDGVEATWRIRRLPGPVRDIPIVALTANVLASEQERYLGAGMNECLMKPIEWERLFAVVARFGGTQACVDAATPAEAEAPTDADILIDAGRLADLQALTTPEQLRKLMTTALDTAMSARRRMIEDSDLATLVADAHQLKGSCGTLGLVRIARTAAGIQEAAGAGRRDSELLGRLGRHVEETRVALDAQGLL